MKILAKTKLGNLDLKNKMVMAQMTRSRTDEDGVVPDIAALYYAQRAGAGLIISEAINISEQAIGLPYTPGIYTKHQIEAWKNVTNAVHNEDGKIFAQLWHTGRAGHSLNRKGELPVSASARAIQDLEILTPNGKMPYEVPMALSTKEVKQVILDNLTHYATDVLETYGKMVKKHIIINGGYDRETAETEIESDRAQFVSFGSLFLSNPELPKQFALNAYINEADRATMHGNNHESYTDYPFFTA